MYVGSQGPRACSFPCKDKISCGSGTANACHGSDSAGAACEELSFFFSGNLRPQHERAASSTLGIIKPHAVQEGNAGLIINRIQEAFNIESMQMFTLDRVNSAEFYEVYRDVLSPGLLQTATTLIRLPHKFLPIQSINDQQHGMLNSNKSESSSKSSFEHGSIEGLLGQNALFSDIIQESSAEW